MNQESLGHDTKQSDKQGHMPNTIGCRLPRRGWHLQGTGNTLQAAHAGWLSIRV